jgi:hypothetical protein
MAAIDVQKKFKADMQAAGYPVRTYAGRGFYFGYAVKVKLDGEFDKDDVIRATKIKLRSDSLGKGVVMYPTVGVTESQFTSLEGSDE